MTVRVIREQEVLQEATEVLVQHLAPAKVARFLAAAQVGGGDYLAIRAEVFAGETVATLVEKVQRSQGERQQP
jgi:N-dimethylarginine dimethylaminohydrolase